ncbi:MAG: flagellar assembly protein FliX [Alphaproteobacteria bacterium]|nr:flagellar assembly protein FliX [Alphaproteobacteria bacterium]
MKITGSGKFESAPVRRRSAVRSRDGVGFSVDQPDNVTESRPVTGAAPVPVVSSLLSIQEVDDRGHGRANTLNEAEEMLDLLDDIRHGLLTGALPERELRRLLALSSVKREGFIDPRLSLILSDIELRAKVELAKLEMSKVIF